MWTLRVYAIDVVKFGLWQVNFRTLPVVSTGYSQFVSTLLSRREERWRSKSTNSGIHGITVLVAEVDASSCRQLYSQGCLLCFCNLANYFDSRLCFRDPRAVAKTFTSTTFGLISDIVHSVRRSCSRRVEYTGENPSSFQAERDEIWVLRTAAWAGGTHEAGPEPPLCDQTGSDQPGLKTSKRSSDIFKAKVWWVGQRKTGEAEGGLERKEVETSPEGRGVSRVGSSVNRSPEAPNTSCTPDGWCLTRIKDD